MFDISAFSLLTIALLSLTVWVAVARFTARVDSSWPLFYYLYMVVYLKAFDWSLDPYLVYVGTVSALFLRFEFMGGWFLKIVRAAELCVLGYVAWRSFTMLVAL